MVVPIASRPPAVILCPGAVLPDPVGGRFDMVPPN
jgi:hypothetical protein